MDAVKKRNKAEETSNIDTSAIEDTPVTKRRRPRVSEEAKRRKRKPSLTLVRSKSSSSESSNDFVNNPADEFELPIPSACLFKTDQVEQTHTCK